MDGNGSRLISKDASDTAAVSQLQRKGKKRAWHVGCEKETLLDAATALPLTTAQPASYSSTLQLLSSRGCRALRPRAARSPPQRAVAPRSPSPRSRDTFSLPSSELDQPSSSWIGVDNSVCRHPTPTLRPPRPRPSTRSRPRRSSAPRFLGRALSLLPSCEIRPVSRTASPGHPS